MHERLRTLCFSVAVLAALAACEQQKAAGDAPAAAAADRAGPALVDVRLSERHGVCLRLPPGDRVEDRRTDAEADLATLRHAAGSVTVYIGGHPDFPGFRRVTRHAGDTVTPAFRPLADTVENGQRFLLFGHKRRADQPRVYVMFSGAESAFAGDAHLDADDIADCAATP